MSSKPTDPSTVECLLSALRAAQTGKYDEDYESNSFFQLTKRDKFTAGGAEFRKKMNLNVNPISSKGEYLKVGKNRKKGLFISKPLLPKYKV